MLFLPVLVLLASASAAQLGKGQLEDHLRTTHARLREPFLVGVEGESNTAVLRGGVTAPLRVDHLPPQRVPAALHSPASPRGGSSGGTGAVLGCHLRFTDAAAGLR